MQCVFVFRLLFFLLSVYVFFFSPTICLPQTTDGKHEDDKRLDKRVGGASNSLCPVQAPQCCQEKFVTSSPFSSQTPFLSYALHDVFVEHASVHKRGRLRDQTAREMLTSEQSYAATLEEVVSVCGTNKPKQCTSVKTNPRSQRTCFRVFLTHSCTSHH